jgi:transposase
LVRISGTTPKPQAGLEAKHTEDEAYQCLLTVPGNGPKTAAAQVASIGISLFRDDSRLAAYCGLAPEDRDSGT